MTRSRRVLSAEERRLWAEVIRSVRPLRAPPPDLPGPPEPAATAAPAPSRPKPRPAAPSAAAPRPPSPPPLAPIERRTARALARGRISAEGVLDLHGLTQAEAHSALIRFLHASQGRGRTLVLVVTGKGGPGSGALSPAIGAGERGVLRRMVPHWLAQPDLRRLVLGFDEAPAHRGGIGALYIRLRRPRDLP